MRLKLLQKDMHTHAYCSTTCNSHAMETTKIPHKWQMDQENVVFMHRAILLTYKQWNFVIYKWMDGTEEHHLKWS
jgi:hypothetical protein